MKNPALRSPAGLLARTPVFARLAPDDVAELARIAVRREYGREQFIFLEGEYWPYCLYLASGRLATSLTDPAGRHQHLLDLDAGCLVWGYTFFDDLPVPTDLEVREEAVTFQWDRETLRPILRRNPDAEWEVFAQLLQSCRRTREVVYSFAFQTVANRLAGLLLREYPGETSGPVERDLTLADMAAYVGSTPALVCKTLYGFADQGLLRVSRSHFEFLDRASLRRIALAEQLSPSRHPPAEA